MSRKAGKLALNSTLTLLSGNQIPMIGFGTYQLKGQDCKKATKAAIQSGYRHIDSASFYNNEQDIKNAIKETGVKRQQLYIATKVAPNQQGSKQSKAAINKVLQKFGFNYIDLALIHWPGTSKYGPQDKKNQQLRLQTWNSLIELQKEGKIKDIGVSNFLRHHLQHLKSQSSVLPSVNQFQVHPLLWQAPTIDFCRQHKIAIQAYSPLARQHQKLTKNQTMLELSKKYNKTVSQIALRWAIQHGFIVLPKSKGADRVKENANIFDFEIQGGDVEKIDRLREAKVRTCWDPNTIKY